MHYGFEMPEIWCQYSGEVFRIFAKGKGVEWRVREGDDDQPGRLVSHDQLSTQRTRKCTGFTKPLLISSVIGIELKCD